MANQPTLELQRGDSVGNGSVKIPQLTARSQINALPSGPRASGENVSNDIGRSLMNAGNALEGVGQDLDRQEAEKQRLLNIEIQKEKEKQTLSASQNSSASTLALQEDFATQQASVTNGADGFAKTIQSRIDQHIEDATKDATPYYAEQYRKQMQPVKQHLVGQAIAFQTDEGLRYQYDQIIETTQNSAVAVQKDPTMYEMKLADVTATINSNNKLKPDNKRDLITKARNELNVAAGYGYIDSNPIEFSKTLKESGGTYHMPEVSESVGKYSDVVSRASERTGVDPAILTAQISAESGGNASAKSPKGAQGVSQFMPDTAKRYGVDVTDPVSSIVGQARYMGDLLNQFGGDYAKALAGYNWGEGNVQKAQEQYGDEWLTHAPKETRDYVAKIMKDTGGDTQHMEVGHEIVPIGLSGHPWFDNASLETQMKLKQYADTKATGAMAQIGINVATGVANEMVSDKPINADEASKQAIQRIESSYGPITSEQKTAITSATVSAVNRAESNWRRNRESQLITAYDTLDKSGGDYAAFIAQNPVVYASMNQKQKEQVNKYAGYVKQGGNVPTDWDMYADLVANPTYLKAVNLDALKSSMNMREMNTLKTMQKTILENPAAEDNIINDAQAVKNQLNSAGITGKEKQAEFYSILQQGINQELQATGKKKLTQEETLSLSNKLLVKVITDKGFVWDSKATVAQLKVPDTEKAKIVQALNEQRIPATDFNIKRAYANKLTKENGAVK